MVTTSVVRLSELEGQKRIDAEYYRSDILDLKEAVSNCPFKVTRLGEITEKGYRAVYWNTKIIPREEMKNDDVFFLQASDIDDVFPYTKAEEMGGVWHRDWEDYPEGRVIIGELLIEVKGKAEKAALVPKDFPRNTMISGTLYKLLVRDDIEAEYVLVYLLSKYGKGFRDRLKTNLLVSFVNKRDLLNISIVIIPSEKRREISDLYSMAYKSYVNSKNLYFQAESLLLEELKIADFKPKPELVYIANFSKTGVFHRIDAEYFQPAYDEVISKIVQYHGCYSHLLDYAENIKPNFDPTRYPQEKFLYVELADIDASIGVINSASETKGEKTPSRARRRLKTNDVIVSSIEGSLDRVALVKKEHEGYLASTGFFQLRPKEISPEVLLVLSKSVLMRTQLKKECTGTILTAVPNEALKRILLPILPDEVGQKITTLVQQSHEARNRARNLLEEAKRKVEETIDETQN